MLEKGDELKMEKLYKKRNALLKKRDHAFKNIDVSVNNIKKGIGFESYHGQQIQILSRKILATRRELAETNREIYKGEKK